MIVTVLDSKALRLTLEGEEELEMAKAVCDGEASYWAFWFDVLESHTVNGSYVFFDSSEGNPFIGLTSAPAIAESIIENFDGSRSIDGGCWFFGDYQIRSEVEEMVNAGFVDFEYLGCSHDSQ